MRIRLNTSSRIDKKNRKRILRSARHGCDGFCYYSTGMCPYVDTCEETRVKEFFVTLMAVTTMVGVPLVISVLVVLWLFSLL